METTITRRSFIVVPVITDRVEDNVRARYQMARIIRREVLPHGRGFKSKSNRVRKCGCSMVVGGNHSEIR